MLKNDRPKFALSQKEVDYVKGEAFLSGDRDGLPVIDAEIVEEVEDTVIDLPASAKADKCQPPRWLMIDEKVKF